MEKMKIVKMEENGKPKIVKMDAELLLDLLKPEDKEDLCKKLGGMYDKERNRCIIKVIVDEENPNILRVISD